MEPNGGEITLLLRQWQTGDRDAEARLFELLLPELRRIASRYLGRERPGHTLQPTALVNEAFLRLATSKGIDLQDRGHFLAIAARIMRRHLIDHARGRPAVEIVPLQGIADRFSAVRTPLDWAIAIDCLLDELGTRWPQRRSVVELKFYLGLTDGAAAEALNLSLRSLQREWFVARRWLFERLNTEPCRATPSATSV